MNEIDLVLDEENELTFQLNIEGSRPAQAICRLNVQGDNMNLLFEAQQDRGDEINVVLPPLAHVLKEGSYNMSLEVVVDDKYFVPLELTGNFEKSVRVTAEAVVRTKKKTIVPQVTLVQNKTRPARTRDVINESEDLDSKRIQPVTNTNNTKRVNETKKKSVSDDDILKIIEALTKKGK